MTPAELRQQSFATSRRGYDRDEVDRLLATTADQLEQLRARVSQLEDERDALRDRAGAASSPEDALQAVGERTAAILVEAERAAAATRQRADHEAAVVRNEAEQYDTTLRSEAETYATELRAAAEAYDTEVREGADAYDIATRDGADEHAARVREQAEQQAASELAAARQEAERTRQEADTYALDTRTTADRESREVVERARREAEAQRAAAEREARRLVADAGDRASRITTAAAAERDAALAEAQRYSDIQVRFAEEVRAVAEAAVAASGRMSGIGGLRAATDDVVDSAEPDPLPPSLGGDPAPDGAAPAADEPTAEDAAAEPGADPAAASDADDTLVEDEDDGDIDLTAAEVVDADDGPADDGEAHTPAAEDAPAATDEGPTAATGGTGATPEDGGGVVDLTEAPVPAGLAALVGGGRGAAPSDRLAAAATQAAVAAGLEVAEAPDGEPDAADLRERSLVTVRPGLLRRLRRGLQDLQNGVLESVRERGADGTVDSLLPDDDAAGPLVDAARPFLDAGHRAGRSDAAVLLGRDPEDVAAVDVAAVDAAAAALAARLLDELRTTLRPSLAAGIEAEEPGAALSERVGEVFRDLKGPVVETAVQESLVRGYGEAALGGWADAGVEQVVWLRGEETRCPEGACRADADEGPRPLGTPFASGHVVPPAHAGCTCAVRPA